MLTMMHKVLKKLFHVFSSTFYLNLFLLIPSWPEAEVQQMTIWQNVNHKLRVKGSKTQRRQTKKCKQLRGLFFLGRKKSQGRKDKDGQSSYMTPLAASTFGSTTHYMSVDCYLQTHCFTSSLMPVFQEGRSELCHILIPSCRGSWKIIFKVGEVAFWKKTHFWSMNE